MELFKIKPKGKSKIRKPLCSGGNAGGRTGEEAGGPGGRGGAERRLDGACAGGPGDHPPQRASRALGACRGGGSGAAPEVVAPLLQLEGVLGPAVTAPAVQVAVPADVDTHSPALHIAHTAPAALGASPAARSRAHPTRDPPAAPDPQRPLRLRPRGPRCGTRGRRGWSGGRSGRA